jgi:hypothetical protein
VSDYYVYTYIDPRNFEEFYYGKGRGSRKESHLEDVSDSEKVKRIQAIKNDGQEPIIRVIAARLTEDEAHLIEATLIWSLGRFTTNLVGGRYEGRFRPHNTYHLSLSGFDYEQALYYYNIGEGPHRNWDDYAKYGFISAGQGPRWRDAICAFQTGDVIAAYLRSRGYVGIGRIAKAAQRIRDVEIAGSRLLDLPLSCGNMGENAGDPEKSEYVALVDWVRKVSRNDAKFERNAGLFTTTHVRASLDRQPRTVAFLDEAFGVSLETLVQ